MAWLPAPGHPANREVIERRDRVGLRPQSHPTGLEARVPMIEIELAVEPCLHVIAEGDEAHRMPLAERRWLDARGGDLPASAIVVVQPEVVLERVGADDIVLAVVEAEDDAARGVFTPGDRLELHRYLAIGVGAGRRDDDVEWVPGRALDQHFLAARRAGHLLHRPLPVHRRPA